MTVYLDIETLDFFSDPHIKALPRAEQLAAMRFGCAVTYNAVADEWLDWTSALDLYVYIIRASAVLVGWNIVDFDWPVIRANVQPASLRNESQLGFVDLFAEIRRTTGRWYKLEDVCQANLGRGKLADGQRAAEWLRSGDWALIEKAMQYCRHDVELTVSLYSRLLGGDPLILPARPARGEVEEIRWTLSDGWRFYGWYRGAAIEYQLGKEYDGWRCVYCENDEIKTFVHHSLANVQYHIEKVASYGDEFAVTNEKYQAYATRRAASPSGKT